MILQDAEIWWSAVLTEDPEYERFCSRNEQGIYTLRISRKNCDWRMAVGDFISYTQMERKNAVLMIGEQELAEVQEYYQGHTCIDAFFRVDEPCALVHSTPLENWNQIKQDGCVKSWSILKHEARIQEEKPIGYELGDPADFQDYVMLGRGAACEIIVSSRQKGHIVMSPDEQYQSGARLYFDAKRLAEDGLLIRDGAHVKVKKRLPLRPYLMWVATWENIGLLDRISTPSIFAAMADCEFERRLKDAVGIYADY